MTFARNKWTLQISALSLTLMLLTSCGKDYNRLVYVDGCPPLREYSETFVMELADWLEVQPEGSPSAEFAKDHMVLRKQVRACTSDTEGFHQT